MSSQFTISLGVYMDKYSTQVGHRKFCYWSHYISSLPSEMEKFVWQLFDVIASDEDLQ